MEQQLYFVLGWGAPIVSALFALFLIKQINGHSTGTEQMQRIAALIRSGAMAFLKTEYTVLSGFVVVMFVVLWAFVSGLTATAFLVGALLSASAGWIGMRTATGAAVRTTQAAKTSLSSALRVAFSSGAVMGLTVVALGTLGIAVLYYLFGGLSGAGRSAVDSLFGFSLGASSIALFARVGGGIFTKAADVAGDLSGKVEAGIPEDDPRNPATIADNVGDNVGDVAGMGADLFESYVGSIISAIALAWALGAPTIILGGIYSGIFSPTEAAGVACVYAIFVTMVVYRDLSYRDLFDVAAKSVYLTAQVFIIVAAAGVYSWLLTVTGAAQAAVDFIAGMEMSTWLVLLVINIFLLLIGAVLDTVSAILVLTPLLADIALALGVHPVHFGLIAVLNLTIGTFTPPFGFNIFVAQAVFRVQLAQLYPGLMPFIALAVVALMIITYVPAISLWILRYI